MIIFALKELDFFNQCLIFHIVNTGAGSLFDMLQHSYCLGKVLLGFSLGCL
jgi:hypothetical protein